jgi:hypothetical protein
MRLTRGRSPGLRGSPALRGIKANKHKPTSFRQGLNRSRFSDDDYGGFRLKSCRNDDTGQKVNKSYR